MHDTPHSRCMIYMHSSNNTAAAAAKCVVFLEYLYGVYACEHIVFVNDPRRVMGYIFLLVRVYNLVGIVVVIVIIAIAVVVIGHRYNTCLKCTLEVPRRVSGDIISCSYRFARTESYLSDVRDGDTIIGSVPITILLRL